MLIKNIVAPGYNLEQSLELVQELNQFGVAGSLSHLPTRKNRPEELAHEAQHYRLMLRRIAERRLDADVTLKLHQFGIYADYELSRDFLLEVLAEARRLGLFVWIDMERRPTVDHTIRLYLELREHHDRLGICLQAYLRRTEQDVEYLLRQDAVIRLVKGFYNDYDIEDWADVTKNYERLMERLIAHGGRYALATHDLDLVARAKDLIRASGGDGAEFQFFRGVRDEEAKELAREGFRSRVYLVHGPLLSFLWDGLPTFDLRRNLKRLLHLNVN